MDRSADQKPPDPLPPEPRSDEEAVKFAGHNGGESDRASGAFRDDHVPIGNLAFRQKDCFGVSDQSVAISIKCQRRFTLDLL